MKLINKYHSFDNYNNNKNDNTGQVSLIINFLFFNPTILNSL